jgi:hypothetical protein
MPAWPRPPTRGHAEIDQLRRVLMLSHGFSIELMVALVSPPAHDRHSQAHAFAGGSGLEITTAHRRGKPASTQMTSLPDKLKRHLSKMAAGDISDSTTNRLMALLRQLLEERAERNRYPITAMFCDWSLHTKLDRSQAASALLDLLDDTWVQTANADADQLIQKITDGLNPHKLRAEIVQLLGSAFIHAGVVLHDAGFAATMDHLLAELVDKPITRRPQHVQSHTSKRLAQGHRFMAVRLFFCLNEDKKHTPAKYVLNLMSQQIEPAPGGHVNVVIPWPLAADRAGTILF